MSIDKLSNNLISYVSTLDASTFEAERFQVYSLSQLTAGLHNANFLLQLKTPRGMRRYVVRFYPSNKAGQDKTANEAANMKLLSGLPVPKLVHSGKPSFINSTLIITEFAAGKHKNFNALTKTQLKGLARIVATIHHKTNATYSPEAGAAPSKQGSYQDYFRDLTNAMIVQPLSTINPGLYQDSFELIQKAISLLYDKNADQIFTNNPKGFSLLHMDLSQNNILWQANTLTIIDWEDVTFGDPADEIAYILTINNLRQTVAKCFLDEYLHHYSDDNLTTRLPAYILRNRLLDLVWSIGKLNQYKSGKESGFTIQSAQTYRQFYAVRRAALATLLAKIT